MIEENSGLSENGSSVSSSSADENNVGNDALFDVWITRHKWRKSLANIGDLMVPLERKLHGHPLAGLLWERQFEEILLDVDGTKDQIGMSVCSSKQQGLFLSVHVDDMKMAWKSRVWLPCECKPNEVIVEEDTKMFESRILLLEELKNYQGGTKLAQRRLLGPTTWKDMLENASSDTASWLANKKVEQLYKVSSPLLG